MRTPSIVPALLAASLTLSSFFSAERPSRAQAPAPAAEPTAPPAAPSATLLSVDPTASTVSFQMVHKLHKFTAVTKKAEGKVRVLPSGAAQIMVRAPVESFDSGNTNRDAHMKEVTEAARYPTVDLKGLCDSCATPAKFPTTVDKTIKGELSFHGVKKSLDVPVKLTYESAGRVRAAAHLTLSLDEFKIERPSLMFVKVDDALNVDVDIVLKQ